MTNSPGPNLELKFQDCLLAAISEVARSTRLGLAAIRKDIQNIGGLQAAKTRLGKRGKLFNLFRRPSDYFLTTRRVGRMDLSIEAIALDPAWRGLFTRDEIDQAMATLSEYGFNPALDALTATTPTAQAQVVHEPSLARIRLNEPRRGFSLDLSRVLSGEYSECEVTAKSAAALRNLERPPAQSMVRKHVGECLRCRDLYPDLVAAFERFDELALTQWIALLSNFQATMELGDEHLERFMLTGPDDYEDRVQYECDLDVQLSYSIRPMLVWRAVRLGCQVGRFMSAFAAMFAEPGDVWLTWRKGEIQNSVSAFVRSIDRKLFLLAVLARNLLLVRPWPAEDEGVLWMPADEELIPVPGVLQVDSSNDLEEWEELLGQPPQDLNLDGILYLAHYAAVAELREVESASGEPVTVREPQEQLDRMEAMLRAMQSSQAEALERQDAIIGQLERMVLYMKSTDRCACEDSLMAKLPGVYERLTEKARNLFLASEQIYRTPGFAAPGNIIHGLATAFELQLQHSVMAGLFDHLKYRRVETLRPLAEWKDAEQRDKPLWWTGAKADKCTLGTMKLILRHPHCAIEEFFTQFGLNLADIQAVIELVCSHRNPATHGDCFDIGTAEAIRADWFHWNKRPGGVFSVFFRNA